MTPKLGDDVFEGDIIRTKKTGFVKILLTEDGSEITLTKLSRFEIEKIEETLREFILKRGKLKAEVKPQKGKFIIETTNAVAGVKGTVFFLTTNWNSTLLFVKEGQVSFSDIQLKGQVELGNDQISFVYRGRAPVLPRVALEYEKYEIIKDFEEIKVKAQELETEERVEKKEEVKEEMIRKEPPTEQRPQLKEEDVGAQVGGAGLEKPAPPQKPQPPPITEKDKNLQDLIIKEKEMKVKVKVK